MKPIRTHIMSRKLQWSVARCFQCSTFKRACGLPCMVPCRRLPVLVKGRLYHHFLCSSCIESIWGTVSASSTLLSRLCEQQTQGRVREEPEAGTPPESVDQPFKRGKCIGHALIAHGILDHVDLTNAGGCHETARRYAECAYPLARAEDQRVLVAGILHAWMIAHAQGEERA